MLCVNFVALVYFEFFSFDSNQSKEKRNNRNYNRLHEIHLPTYDKISNKTNIQIILKSYFVQIRISYPPPTAQ